VAREAEPVVCENFTLETCGCQLAGGGRPCSSLFSLEYYQQYRAQAFLLTKEQLDMALMGSVAATVCEDDDVGVRSGHKPAKRQRTNIQYMHKGYQVCQKTYNFLHTVGRRKVHNIKEHFLDQGLVVREHGNVKKRPHNALTFARITSILKFIENYAEQHAILLPGRIPGFKRDDVSVLPSSDSKQVISLYAQQYKYIKVKSYIHTVLTTKRLHTNKTCLFQKIYDQYVLACGRSEDSDLQPVSYRTFCRYWHLQLPHVVIGRPRTDLCWTCQQNSMVITKMANTSDQQKQKVRLTCTHYVVLHCTEEVVQPIAFVSICV